MKVIEFKIQESKVNKGLFILIAKTEDGKQWVCSGDHYSPTYLTPLETAFDNGFDSSVRGSQAAGTT